MIYSDFRRFFIWALLVLIICITFAGGYAAHKKGYGGFFVNDILRIKSKYFLHLYKGYTADTERISIDIKQKNFSRLEYQRQKALEAKYLIGSDYEDIPIKIRYKDLTIKAKARLKGSNSDHWSVNDMWSLKINLKGENRLWGMDKFSIQNPKTRGFMDEWYLQKFLAHLGLISRRYEFIKVNINGKKENIFALEESINKELIENSKLRDGVILEYSDELFWRELIANSPNDMSFDTTFYIGEVETANSPKLINDKALNYEGEIATSLLNKYKRNEIEAKLVFDIEKMAKLMATTDLFGSSHPHELNNIKFYFNPFTSLLEPIANDVTSIVKTYILSGDKNFPYYNDYNKLYISWEKRLISDPIFIEEYIKQLEHISSEDFLNEFFSMVEDDAQKNIDKLHFSYPFYSFDKREIIENNALFIRNILNPNSIARAYFIKSETTGDSSGRLLITNLHRFPLILIDTPFASNLESKDIILDGKISEQPINYKSFDINEKLSKNIDQLKINFSLVGSNKIHSIKVEDFPYNKNQIYSYPNTKISNIDDYAFIIKDGNTITFKAEKLVINENIIIPKGYEVIANQGLEIDLQNGAAIYSYSPIKFIGTKEMPVKIYSSDESGFGVIVIKANKESILKHVIVKDTGNINENVFATGALTFYESPVKIEDSFFLSNNSEDALNIIRTRFTIDRTKFDNNRSDSLDIDYSDGDIRNSFFDNNGNDAIDLSGSNVYIESVVIKNVKDKAISAGEKSQVEVNGVKIYNSDISITSKDSSILNGNNISIKNSKVGLAVFRKKSEFGPAKMTINNISFDQVENHYLLEDESLLEINQMNIDSNNAAVKDVLYGEVYGKASGID